MRNLEKIEELAMSLGDYSADDINTCNEVCLKMHGGNDEIIETTDFIHGVLAAIKHIKGEFHYTD